MLFMAALFACADPPLPCRDGFTRAGDGHCYPPYDIDTELDLEDALDALPCGRVREGAGVSFEGGCAAGFCAGDLYTTARALLGETDTCFLSGGDQYCTWPNGLGGRWDDEDGEPGPDPFATNQRVRLQPPYMGTSAEGLGVWGATGCVSDALGMPDTATLVDTADGVFAELIDYDAYGILAYDVSSMDGVPGADGIIDDMYIYGAP